MPVFLMMVSNSVLEKYKKTPENIKITEENIKKI